MREPGMATTIVLSDDDSPRTGMDEGECQHSGPQPKLEPCPPSTSAEVVNKPHRELRRLRRKECIRALEFKLNMIEREILRYASSDVGLDDMDGVCSPYIVEDRLYRRFLKLWTKYQKLTGDTESNRSAIRVRSATNRMIGRYVEAYMQKKRAFPDLAEMEKIVKKAAEKYTITMTEDELTLEAKVIFEEVGNQLQRMRKKELLVNLDTYIWDRCEEDVDPAETDPVLRSTLRANRKLAKKNLDELFTEYATRVEVEADAEVDVNDKPPTGLSTSSALANAPISTIRGDIGDVTSFAEAPPNSDASVCTHPPCLPPSQSVAPTPDPSPPKDTHRSFPNSFDPSETFSTGDNLPIKRVRPNAILKVECIVIDD